MDKLWDYIYNTNPNNVDSDERNVILSSINIPISYKEQLKDDIKNNWYEFSRLLSDKKYMNYETTIDDIRYAI